MCSPKCVGPFEARCKIKIHDPGTLPLEDTVPRGLKSAPIFVRAEKFNFAVSGQATLPPACRTMFTVSCR